MPTAQSPILTAPLAGVSTGLQAQGVWAGRRQLLVRFAGEAETATMYRADALAREITRLLGRTPYHSVSISGRDALGCADFLVAALGQVASPPPIMLDTDGDRSAAILLLRPFLRMIQVTLDVPVVADGRGHPQNSTPERARDTVVKHAIETIVVAAELGIEHALVLAIRDEVAGSGDSPVVRIVEQAHAASEKTAIIVHPTPGVGDRFTLDRRWATLAEQLGAVHADVRIALRLPGPAALR